MFHDFEEIRTRAQAARRRELERLFAAALLALARGAERLVRAPAGLAQPLGPADRPGC